MMGEDNRDRSRDRDNRRERQTRFSDGGRDRSPDRGKDRGGMKSSNARVFISNIPYEYRWQDLKDLFRSQVGDVAFVELFVDENDKPRGCGIVEFSDPSSVKKCLEVMHRFELKGRKIIIKEDFGNSRDKFGNLVGRGRGPREDRGDRGGGGEHWPRNDDRGNDFGGPMGGDKWGNTYGLSPAFLDNLQIHVPLCTRVFVANLDYKVDKKKLKEVFRLAGKVMRVDLAVDKEGKSRGFGVVEFSHPVESVQAISMFHNHELFERQMTVRMDRYNESMKLPEGLKSVGPGLGDGGSPLRDVAYNLPNQGSPQGVGAQGQGILGAVPNLPMATAAAALTNLNSVGNLGSLNPSAVLQAANLAGVGGLQGNLISSSVGGGDLGLANLVQNQSLAALAGNQSGLNGAGGNFNRSDNFSGGGGGGGAGGRNYSSYDQKPMNFGNFGGSGDRDSHSNNFPGNTSNPMTRSGNTGAGGAGGGFDRKYQILIQNLPPTATFKMLNEKCREFGDVQNIEDKGNGAVVVTFSSEWDVERAIKNLDRARIDGRTIGVRIY